MQTSKREHAFDDTSGIIIEAAIGVHRILGPHFQELTYQRALFVELQALNIEFAREVEIPVYYRSKRLHTRRVDFLVEDCIVETKAKRELEPRDFEQTLSYLKASDFRLALLLNFGSTRLQIRRIVN